MLVRLCSLGKQARMSWAKCFVRQASQRWSLRWTRNQCQTRFSLAFKSESSSWWSSTLSWKHARVIHLWLRTFDLLWNHLNTIWFFVNLVVKSDLPWTWDAPFVDPRMIEKVNTLKTSLAKRSETLTEQYGQGMLDGFSSEFLGCKTSILGSMQPQRLKWLNYRTPVPSEPQLETRLRSKMNDEIRHARKEFRPKTCQYRTRVFLWEIPDRYLVEFRAGEALMLEPRARWGPPFQFLSLKFLVCIVGLRFKSILFFVTVSGKII